MLKTIARKIRRFFWDRYVGWLDWQRERAYRKTMAQGVDTSVTLKIDKMAHDHTSRVARRRQH